MRVIIVDDELMAMKNLEMTFEAFTEITEVTSFSSPHKAIDWLQVNKVDVAFLDIKMNQMNGLALAKRLKEICPSCKIVFVTGYSQYALQAIQMHASGYLLKPARMEDIRYELDYILNPPREPIVLDKQIRIQCFGNFEVFIGSEPMKFQYSKTKELLAYLIDRRGAFCSNGEIIGILWEDRISTPGLSSQFRNLLADLIAAFKLAGNVGAIRKQRGMTAIAPEIIICDYYSWSRGEIAAINAYAGEYMSQYSWGEFTLGGLESKGKN